MHHRAEMKGMEQGEHKPRIETHVQGWLQKKQETKQRGF